jgi:hypothetical protein
LEKKEKRKKEKKKKKKKEGWLEPLAPPPHGQLGVGRTTFIALSLRAKP